MTRSADEDSTPSSRAPEDSRRRRWWKNALLRCGIAAALAVTWLAVAATSNPVGLCQGPGSDARPARTSSPDRRELGGAQHAGPRAPSSNAASSSHDVAGDAAADHAEVTAPSSVAPSPPPALAIAVAARTRGDLDGALGALDAAVGPRREGAAAYFEGRVLEALGRASDAADAYGRVGDDVPVRVREDVRARRAASLATAGRCREAMPLLEGDGSTAGHFDAGRCAFALGDFARAIRELSDVAPNARGVDAFGAHILLANAYARAGDAARERATLIALLVARPEHRDVGAVEARLVAAQRARRGPRVVSFSVAQRLDRAERLLAVRAHDATLAELDRIRPRTRAERARKAHLRGSALYAKRDRNREAAAALLEAARLGASSAVSDERYAASALLREGDVPGALAIYRRVARTRSGRDAARATFRAALLELERGRPNAMRRFLRGASAERIEDEANQGRFWLALDSLTRGRTSEARELFSRYGGQSRDPMVGGRAAYWRGRTEERAGRVEPAKTAYREAREIAWLHWYGALAEKRLAALGEAPVAARPGPAEGAHDEVLPRLAPTLPDAVRFYASLGFDVDAREALRAAETAVRRAAPAGRGAEALIAAYEAVGDHARAHRLASRELGALLAAPPTRETRWAWDAAYPTPFGVDVDDAAAEARVDPALVYAIMRQESGYYPRAVSPANAIGLLQLLPGTARAIGRAKGLEVARDDLFDPALNARLGATYIANMLTRFRDEIPLALAAYNAGPHRVDTWLSARGELPMDLFVERIPYDETRNYVRRVSSHYLRYGFLASREPALDPARRADGTRAPR